MPWIAPNFNVSRINWWLKQLKLGNFFFFHVDPYKSYMEQLFSPQWTRHIESHDMKITEQR